MFIAEKISKRIRRNKAVYAVVILELIFGISFLSYSLNQYLSYLDNKHELEQIFSDNTMSVEITIKESEGSEALSVPFNYADSEKLKKLTDKLKIYLCIPQLIEQNGELEEVIFVYTNQNKNKEYAYLGENIQKRIKNQAKILDEKNGIYESETIKYYGETYQNESMPDGIKDTVIARNTFEKRLNTRDCVMLPLVNLKEDMVIPPAQTIINYSINNGNNMERTNEEIIEYLSKEHPQYSYRVSNYVDDFQQNNESLMEYTKYIVILAIVAMWILTFGYIGITKQLFVKRQREFAICMAAGASKGKIFSELLLENIIVLSVGVTAGNLGGIWLLHLQENNIFAVEYHFEMLLWSILVVVTLTLVVSLPVLKQVYSLEPQEVLRSL